MTDESSESSFAAQAMVAARTIYPKPHLTGADATMLETEPLSSAVTTSRPLDGDLFATAIGIMRDCEEATRELAAHRAASGDVRVLTQLRRLAADPAEEAEVQTAVRGRLSSGGTAR